MSFRHLIVAALSVLTLSGAARADQLQLARDPAACNEALKITRGLIERMWVKPGEARGRYEVELEGEIRPCSTLWLP